MNALTITRFPSITETHGREVATTWPALATMLTTPLSAVAKAMAPVWSPATFNGTRANANVVSVGTLVLDFDDGLPVATAAGIASGLAGAWHTSWSHTPQCPRFRLALALSRVVSPDEYARLWKWASAKFTVGGLAPDPACKDAARPWFLPVRRPGFASGVLPGSPVDVDAILAVMPTVPASGARRVGQAHIGPTPQLRGALPSRVASLIASSLLVRQLWYGEKRTGDTTRSGCDFAVARELLRLGVRPEDVMAALPLRPDVRSRRDDYVRRTVLAALGSLRRTP